MPARLCKRFTVAAALLLFAAAPVGAWAHGSGHGGGHMGGGHRGGHAGGHIGAVHAGGPAGRVVAPGGQFHGGGFHAHGGSPAFHHGHWVHGVRGGTAGWWWVGAAAVPLYVQPVAPAVLVQPQALYYCSALQAYYPETLTCPEPWLLVGPDPGSIPQ